MKQKIIISIAVLSSIVIAAALMTNRIPEHPIKSVSNTKTNHNQNYVQWHTIDSLTNIQLTESALKLVEEIYLKSKRENNPNQQVKALMYRMRLESYKEEESVVKAINRLDATIKESSMPLFSILHSIAAEMYWRYYEQNRWKFYNRTQTTAFQQDDIRTWDLSKIVEATSTHYKQSLLNKDELKKYPLSEFADILENAGSSGNRRPTLYDFLAHRAIDFFMNTETDLQKPVFEFQIDKVEYFKKWDEFAGVSLDDAKDTLSLKYQALWLMQELIAVHVKDGGVEALVDVDLKRLRFVREHAVVEDKDSLYLAALEALQKRCGQNPVCAEVMCEVARVFNEKANSYSSGTNDQYRWFNIKALEICDHALEKFPASHGACLCTVLKNQILMKQMSLQVEEVVVPDKPQRCLVTWKNVNKIWSRAISVDVEEFKIMMEQRNYNDGDLKKLFTWLRAKKASTEWITTLPDSGDHQTHSIEMGVPALPPGFYVLLSSANKDFSYPENGITLTQFWVSRISCFTRENRNGSFEVYVRDRESGAALANATVKRLNRVYDQSKRAYIHVLQDTYTTDTEGKVTINYHSSSAYENSFSLDITLGKDRLRSDREFYQYRNSNEQEPYFQTFFFTDRSIYRPGQTVYFKGIVLKRKGDASTIVPHKQTEVEFMDVNYQKISSLKLSTNDYGTMSGSFIAPTGVLNGQMHIRNDLGGDVQFSVEEYKRPKFEVIANPVIGQFKLNEPVTVTGQAKAYAGSSVDGAKVNYRVVRSTNYPYWFGWWRFWCPPSPEKEIAHGSTITNDTGGYTINFKAIPDLSITRSYNPTFMYNISVDVVDVSGETRSIQSSVSVGYTALDVSVDIKPQLDKTGDSAFAIKAMNKSGLPEAATGTIKIYKLKSPEVPLRKRLWEKPDCAIMNEKDFIATFPGIPYKDEDQINNWPQEKLVYHKKFDTRVDSLLVLADLWRWQQGQYVIEIASRDAFGQDVKTNQYFMLYSPLETKDSVLLCDLFVPIKESGEPGEKAAFLIGSGEKNVQVLFEVEHKNVIIKKEWIDISNSQKLVEIPIEEKFRGNFGVHFTFVKNGRIYKHDETVNVPWTNKELSFSFESFRNKLLPGQKEEWRVTIKGSKSEKVAAEMVAGMYDASLDAFKGHGWSFNVLPMYTSQMSWDAGSFFKCSRGQLFDNGWNLSSACALVGYPELNWFGFDGESQQSFLKSSVSGRAGGGGDPRARASRKGILGVGQGYSLAKSAPMQNIDAVMAEQSNDKDIAHAVARDAGVALGFNGGLKSQEKEVAQVSAQDLSNVKSRTNLSETAFFYPHLLTNEKGEIIISFTMPEALTKWKMLGFAHTKDLSYGLITKELVTQKQLMVMPNLPRFLRENDSITITTKITNLSDSNLTGSTQLVLTDATTGKSVDAAFGNTSSIQNITVKKGLSTTASWNLKIPEGISAVTIRIVAKADNVSDAEENVLPILTNRMLVTETMPLPVRGKGTKQFTFDKLISQSNNSSTIKNHKLTLEFTQNPAWYAIQALPYLMEFPHECAEQTFSRLYANTIASYIANSSPKIKKVFEAWKSKSPDALLSNLEKNQDLKNAMLEETPWVFDGKNESENKKRIGLLFDLNHMSNQLSTAQNRLQKMQMSNGGWPWFEGMPDDRFITQYIITGFGRLKNLAMITLQNDVANATMIYRGVQYLDNRICEDYEYLIAHHINLDSNNISYFQIQYLYARSFFKDIGIDGQNQKAYDYYKNQAIKYWTRNSRYMQAMIALALNRMNVKNIPAQILKSIKENALNSDEMGMYWKEMNEGYYWYQAPIEAQALYIEAFDEVAHDTASVEAMKVWLLKSKQTQNWKTTKATAEACYALLLRGTDLLSNQNDVTITLGPLLVDPQKLDDVRVEAGTGYFKTSWSGGDIKPEMGKATVTKTGAGVAWGALYWQYFEQLDKISTAETPLKLSKKLFVKRNTDRGPVLDPVSNQQNLKIGDKVTIRIELRADRTMEYVHMKDMRAAGFEPVNVLSGYKWQDGLGYYESTRDVATHFFFSYLPKGTFVFEYDVVVAHKGNFSNGITSIECMYAPEFASHSEGIRIRVGE